MEHEKNSINLGKEYLFKSAKYLLKYLFILMLLLSGFNNLGFSQTVKTVFLTKADTTNNMYLMVTPPETTKITAFMFLMPAFGEWPKDVLVQTDLPIYAAQNGILTFIPVLSTGITEFGVDDSTQNSLKEMIEYCVQKYHLENLKFYIGGFSIGGTCAVKYAELAVKNNYSIKPKAVFGVDPPLDFQRLYNSEVRNLRLLRGIYTNPEDVYVIKRIKEICGGSPQTALANYYKYSPYSFSDTTQTAVKLLKNIPVSFYTEPDINWWMSTLADDYTNLNAIDEAAMINELHLMAGDNIDRLVITHDKGYVMPGKIKKPHSWSILSPKDLINWFNQMNFLEEANQK